MRTIIVIRIVATVLPAFSVSCTTLRLVYRYRRRHLGWDDAWAAFALLSAIILTTGAWLRSDEPGLGPFEQSAHTRMIGFYMAAVAFTCVVWAARLSILCSIIRILPHMLVSRLWAQRIVVLFLLFWFSLLVQKIYLCEHHPAWKTAQHVRCRLDGSVAVFELITDCISDSILVLLPIRLLYGLNLPKAQRKLLMAIFSSSMLTTVVSIAHAVPLVKAADDYVGILAHAEASTALIVCNLSVLVTWAARLFNRSEDLDESSYRITFTRSISIFTRPSASGPSQHRKQSPVAMHSLDSTLNLDAAVNKHAATESTYSVHDSLTKGNKDEHNHNQQPDR